MFFFGSSSQVGHKANSGGTATQQAKAADKSASFWSSVRFRFFGKEVKAADPAPGQAFKEGVGTKSSSLFASIRKWCSFSGRGISSEKSDNKVRSWSFLNWFSKTPEAKAANAPSQQEKPVGLISGEEQRRNLVPQMNEVNTLIIAERVQKTAQPPAPKPTLSEAFLNASQTYNRTKQIIPVASNVAERLEELENHIEGRSNLPAATQKAVQKASDDAYTWNQNIQRAAMSSSGSNQDFMTDLDTVVDSLRAALFSLHPDLQITENPRAEKQEVVGGIEDREAILLGNIGRYTSAIKSLCTKLEELCES